MSPTPVVLVTLVVLLVVYLVTGFVQNFVPAAADIVRLLPLDAEAVLHGQVWRLATYGLLHSLQDPTHLLFNGLALYFFGRDLEMRFGRGKFIAFLVASVVVGGIFVVAGYQLGIGVGACIGFSAACEACVVAWALFNRDSQVLLFFALPVRGIYLLVFAVIMWMTQAVSQSPISASAHLGGILTGAVVWLLVARRNRISVFVSDVMMKLRLKKGPKLSVVPRNKNDRWVN